MTRIPKILSVTFGLAALVLWATPAQAQCTIEGSHPFGNFRNTTAICDDDLSHGNVTGSVHAFDKNGILISTATNEFICLDEANLAIGNSTFNNCLGTGTGKCVHPPTGGDGVCEHDALITCQADAECLDGRISFIGNWTSPNVNGCPAGGLARGRNFYDITDASGNRLWFSVGFDAVFPGYVADNAWPDPNFDPPLPPVACQDPRTGTTIVEVDTTTGAVKVRCDNPPSFSDCDEGSREGGQSSLGTCQQADVDLIAEVHPIALYSTVADCARNAAGLSYSVADWDPQPSTPDGAGNLDTVVTIPTDGSCVYLGCSFGTVVLGDTGSCNNDPETDCLNDGNCALLGACTSDGSTCGSDADCAGGCSHDQSTCASDTDCAAAGVCTVVPLACTSDAECDAFGIGPCILGPGGTCTDPAPGTCDPGICLFPETANEFAIASAAAVPGDTAPAPRARAVSGAFERQNLIVRFITDSELGLAGFEVMRIDKRTGRLHKINDGLIAPKGQSGGGASYEVFIPRGRLKGSTKIKIKSVLNDGSGILSDPASF
jgi:hypothetical protein